MVTKNLESKLWTLHKGVKNKFLLEICKYIQRRYLREQALVTEYHVVILNKREAVKFIASNRTITTTLFGRFLVREFIINYRSRYGTKNPNKLFTDYVKYITTKEIKHSSDIAIACNILRNIPITDSQRNYLLDYVVGRLGDSVPNYIRVMSNDKFQLRIYLVMGIVKEHGILTQ